MSTSPIDAVIDQLDQIIDLQHQLGHRQGYFPALYRRVTIEVKNGVNNGVFEDPARMERFDVLFANRYVEAFENRSRGEPTTRAWTVAFDATENWWPIVLQHLLLGINAHINLDLGIAAALTSPGSAIDGLEKDFARINGILADLVDDVQRQLEQIWPSLVWLGRIAGRTDEAIINFSMEKARRQAWAVAKRLAPLDEAARQSVIDQLDLKTALIGHAIRRPGPLARCVLAYIRLRERGTVREIIDILRR